MKIPVVVAAWAAAAIAAPAPPQDAPAAPPPSTSAETAGPASARDSAKQLTGQLVMSLFDRLLKDKAKPQPEAASQPVAETEVATEQPQMDEEPQEASRQEAAGRPAISRTARGSGPATFKRGDGRHTGKACPRAGLSGPIRKSACPFFIPTTWRPQRRASRSLASHVQLAPRCFRSASLAPSSPSRSSPSRSSGSRSQQRSSRSTSPWIAANARKLGPGVLVARPGATNAARARLRITAANTRIKQRPLVSILTGAKVAGVSRLNGATRGDLEPGGDYEITGNGFGAAKGSIFLRHSGRTITLSVTHWSDGQIFASVPGDIAGLADAGTVELDVGPAGKPVLKTTRFGFRAARADIALPITDAMYSYDRGPITRVAGLEVPTNVGPTARSFDGEYLHVSRTVEDSGSTKRCIAPGFDRIRWNVPVRPGFEVTGYYWYHASEEARTDGRTSFTPRGRYNASWEADTLRIDYGVMRTHLPPFVVIPGASGCTSTYRVKLIVTGPRGLPPV